LIITSCNIKSEKISQEKKSFLKDSVVLKEKVFLNTNDTLELSKETLHNVYGRIKLTCDGMGKPYDEGEQIEIAKRKNWFENEYAKYKIAFYKETELIKEVYTDKSKSFKYEVELQDSVYYFIHLYLKSKEVEEYQRLKIDRNDDVNTKKPITKRHIWINYGGC